MAKRQSQGSQPAKLSPGRSRTLRRLFTGIEEGKFSFKTYLVQLTHLYINSSPVAAGDALSWLVSINRLLHSCFTFVDVLL